MLHILASVKSHHRNRCLVFYTLPRPSPHPPPNPLSAPALWIMAAKCEMEDRGSSESARHLFLRALRFHPHSQKVYQEVREEIDR